MKIKNIFYTSIILLAGFYLMFELVTSDVFSDITLEESKKQDMNEKKAIISGFFYGMVYQEATHVLNQSIIYESNNSGIINCFNNQSENDTNMTLCLDYALQDMKNGVSS